MMSQQMFRVIIILHLQYNEACNTLDSHRSASDSSTKNGGQYGEKEEKQLCITIKLGRIHITNFYTMYLLKIKQI